ncbi:MAG: RnfABCDGE type electron transport complex subunit B [Actinomycetota bacterium]|nr:RnfABCDGE type electron transport complex subunit B [Actinomycetota bacterium]
MDWSLVWKALLALAGAGILLGVVLAMASRRFHVEVDPRVEEILRALPGSNCGACGLPGCEAAAEAVAVGDAPPTICKAGGPDVASEVGKIMGIDVESVIPMVAHIHCRGGRSVSPIKAIYQGVNSCRAAETAMGGGKACPFGCIGLEDCADVCPVNAIAFDDDGIRRVNIRKCTGCGLCADICPRDLIEMVPRYQATFVRCKSRYTGKKALQLCKVACIGCKRCEKVCPHDAIHVEYGFATIDYGKCTNCGECVQECPTGSIQLWVEREDHPEGGEFVLPRKRKKDKKKGSEEKGGSSEETAKAPMEPGDIGSGDTVKEGESPDEQGEGGFDTGSKSSQAC